ncbi:MAG: translation initiation factor IF-2 [Calditrichaeota bacterium]|nr:MAG: translation initiation factor IF-2 [Calditrichota bacterium]
MAKKYRVFQIARELNISNEAAIDFLSKLDKSIQNQMSAVSEELYQEICNKFKKEQRPATPDDEFRQRLREQKRLEEYQKELARKRLEEKIKVATEIATQRPKKVRTQKVAGVKEDHFGVESGVDTAVSEPEVKPLHERPLEELSEVEKIERAKEILERQKQAGLIEEKEVKEKPSVEKEKEEVKKPEPVEEQAKEEVQVVEEVVEETEEVKEEEIKEIQEIQEVIEEAPPKKEKKVEKKAKKEKKKEVEEALPKDKKRKFKKKKKRKISEEEIEESIRQTLAAMGEVKPRRRKKKQKEAIEEIEEEKANVIRVSEYITTAELAEHLNVEPSEVIKKCLELGMMVSINQRLDMDTIVTVADEFGYDVEIIEEYGADILQESEEEVDEETAVSRPPVVTIMGHVDHGKTSLLDFIRKSNIIAGEAGGITQHIGAYEVEVDGKEITFLDTPGHEAFTAMRARGAQVTDIVVLIVAADDGVQPQTIEAINHAKAAGVPIVVAINKIDKPNANPELVKKQLSENGILVEDWGGKYQCVEISAKSGKNVDKLLESILLEAELLELKANPEKRARGVIIESKLDKGKGPVGTVLVQNGTLKIGDYFVAGITGGRVRAMYNERNQRVTKAPPSAPVQVVGFDQVPQAGDVFVVVKSEKEVREITTKRQQLKREQEFRRRHLITLDQISQQVREGKVKELNLIVKADVVGSVEALSDALMKLSNKEVAVNVIHKGVGGISESDVLLASASQAIILGFQVRPTLQARELAQKENVDIRLYRVIYDAVEDVKAALEGLLEPEITEEITATVEVRQTFKVPKVGTVAGCYVVSGKVNRNDFAKIYRENKLIYETKISSLKRFKDDVREVAAGFECGIALEGFDDIKVGDIIETYRKVETARKL